MPSRRLGGAVLAIMLLLTGTFVARAENPITIGFGMALTGGLAPNGKAALFAIETVFDERGVRLPVIASITITDASGRTLSGQTVEACWNSISHAPLLAVGIRQQGDAR